jgi:hypothetical protein
MTDNWERISTDRILALRKLAERIGRELDAGNGYLLGIARRDFLSQTRILQHDGNGDDQFTPDVPALVRQTLRRLFYAVEHAREDTLPDCIAGFVEAVEPQVRPVTEIVSVNAEQIPVVTRATAVMWSHYKQTGKLMPMKDVVQATPGSARTTLYDAPEFKNARDAIKKLRASEPLRGTKSKEGTIEATIDDD